MLCLIAGDVATLLVVELRKENKLPQNAQCGREATVPEKSAKSVGLEHIPGRFRAALGVNTYTCCNMVTGGICEMFSRET